MIHSETTPLSPAPMPMVPPEPAVVLLDDIIMDEMQNLLTRFGMQLELVSNNRVIPGSYWGESEAGLIGNNIYARIDTPVHSILHEACHFICMDTQRREALHRDAGGNFEEENAVCYLQIVLADYITGYSGDRIMFDMDSWGYTFRLGSAHAWFAHEADDARQWLITHGLMNNNDIPTWQVRR